MTPVEAEAQLRTGRRQSLWAPVFFLITALRRVGYAQLIFLFVILSNRGSVVLFGIAPAVAAIAVAAAVLAWWRFTFTLTDDSLVVESGVLNRQRTVVPLAKVQSVAIDQKFLHRPIGLVEARVDTAGSSSAELTIHATDRVTAEVIRDIASQARSAEAIDVGELEQDEMVAPVAPSEVLLERTVGELILTALTTRVSAGLAVLAPVFALSGQLEEWFDISLPQPSFDTGGAFATFVVVVLVVAALGTALVRVLSVIFTDFRLTLEHDGDSLRRSAGLFDRRSTASSLTRVQQFETTTNPVQERTGMRSLRLPTAGDSDEIRVDGIRLDELAVVRDLVLERDVQISATPRGIDQAAAFAWWRWPVLLILVAVGVVTFVWSPIALIGLFGVPFQIWAARRRTRRWAWEVTPVGMRLERGLLATATSELALRRTQTASVSQSLYQRRRGLASVTVRTADIGVTIPFLPLATAQQVRDLALAATEHDRRAWF